MADLKQPAKAPPGKKTLLKDEAIPHKRVEELVANLNATMADSIPGQGHALGQF